jgi:phage baseplate assembly protein W
MSEFNLIGTIQGIQIGLTGIDEIIQNIRIIVTTIKGTVPLDREFGVKGDFIDLPSPLAKTILISELADEIEKQEKRVIVTKVDFQEIDNPEAIDGKLSPRIFFKIKDEYINEYK